MNSEITSFLFHIFNTHFQLTTFITFFWKDLLFGRVHFHYKTKLIADFIFSLFTISYPYLHPSDVRSHFKFWDELFYYNLKLIWMTNSLKTTILWEVYLKLSCSWNICILVLKYLSQRVSLRKHSLTFDFDFLWERKISFLSSLNASLKFSKRHLIWSFLLLSFLEPT